MSGPVGWLRARTGVRVVSALSAALVVALSLLIAGAALVFLLGQSLRGQLRDSALEQTNLIVQRLNGNYQQVANENARNALDVLAAPDDLVQILVAYGERDDPNIVVEAGTDPLLFYLAWGVPLLMLVVAATTYFFAGRALRPVEAIRRQVSAMTEKDLA